MPHRALPELAATGRHEWAASANFEGGIMETTEQVQQRRVRRRTNRRSFLVKGAAVGVGTVGAGWLLTDASPALASGGLTKGDAAILRFLAAAELIETDLWQQYNELAG